MTDFLFPVLVLVLVATAIVGSYFAIQHTKKTGRRSLWSYVLLWPLLFEGRQHGDSRLFSKRELIGWGLLLLLIAVAVAFNL
jgi:hypothetical protein